MHLLLYFFSLMSHHHALFDIRQTQWQMMWTVLLLCLFIMTLLWWSVLGSIWAWVRVFLWMIVLFFLPWRRITNVLWKKDEIDWLERVILSFAFSLSVVPLLVFYANIGWMPITAWLVMWVIISIIAVCWWFLWHKKRANG